ncbi:MAG: FAD-dependent monooxygenase [Cytophagales bacterium]|nr:FAD-dependent monooxygenase [Cytophagales bacterium]
MMKTDVVIVGSGMAGLVLSVLLKEKGVDHVVLSRVENRKTLELPETIPPATLVLLESLNLLELFSKSSSKTFGYHSLWNGNAITNDNFFHHNPYKYGLKLNKKQLLHDLEALVQDHVTPFNNLIEINQSDENVIVEIESNHTLHKISCRIMVDATGRNRAALKHLGISSETFDNQVALSCHLPYFKHSRLIHPIFTESFEGGWGIVSPLNDQVNGMTLYAEKGSPILSQLKDYRNWKAALSKTQVLKDFLTDDLNRKVVGGNANSSRAAQLTGANWLALGDAAFTFDPLSSHGNSNAIYSANFAANAIQSTLTNNGNPSFKHYEDTMGRVFEEYLRQKAKLYDSSISI